MAPVAIIWDGSRHVAAIWAESAPARFLAAEEIGGRVSLIAAGNDEGGPLIGVLPAGSRVVHAVTLSADGELRAVPAQLDERLALGQVDPQAAGLVLVQAHVDAAGALALERMPAAERPAGAAATLAASGLNQASGSPAEGYRLLAGPFLHPADERAALTRITAGPGEAGGLMLAFRGDDGQPADAIACGVLVAHLPAAMREARQALAQLDQDLRLAVEAELDTLAAAPADQRDADASGLGRVAALRRGFRLLHPVAEADGACRLHLPDWAEEDEVLIFAEPRRQLLWSGEGEPASGAPMAIRWQEGGFAALSHRETYAASAATGLTLGSGGGNALVVATPGAAAPLRDDLALAAGRLADSLWQAGAERRPARLGALLAELAAARASAPSAAGPLARLDARAKDPAAPASLFEALAATSGIDPSRTDELGERSLAEQIAMLLWAVKQPGLAARACAVRLLLPLPKPRPQAELERLLGWYEDPALPHLLAREAMGLAGHDRRAMRLLHDIAACAHQSWLDEGVVTEVEQAVAAAGVRRGQRRLSPLDALLLELRRQPQRQPAGAPGLEAVARMRAELGEAAARAGQAPAVLDELTRRLGELTPGEIVLLHGHFAALRREADQILAAGRLIAAWEAAAGLSGLAARAHRSGEALRGAERLAATTRNFAGSLERVEGLGPALAALAADIDRVLGPAGEASARTTALHATLSGFGRLLLAQLALREADAAFASMPFAARALADPEDPGFGAAYRRLRAGTSDTLARYLAAAAAISGIDHEWGTALGRGPAPQAASADEPRENA